MSAVHRSQVERKNSRRRAGFDACSEMVHDSRTGSGRITQMSWVCVTSRSLYKESKLEEMNTRYEANSTDYVAALNSTGDAANTTGDAANTTGVPAGWRRR